MVTTNKKKLDENERLTAAGNRPADMKSDSESHRPHFYPLTHTARGSLPLRTRRYIDKIIYSGLRARLRDGDADSGASCGDRNAMHRRTHPPRLRPWQRNHLHLLH